MASSLTPQTNNVFSNRVTDCAAGALGHSCVLNSTETNSSNSRPFQISPNASAPTLKKLSTISDDFLRDNIRLYSRNGVLSIQGTAADDRVVVDANSSVVTVTVRGVGSKEFATSEVSNIRFFGEAGDDTFHNLTSIRSVAFGGAGKDTFVGGSARDIFRGGAGADILRGRQGNDLLSGNFGNDQIFGSGGSDRLLGNEGDDVLRGGLGVDEILGHDGADALFGGEGIDKLFGAAGNDFLSGGTEGDEIFGGVGVDQIFGGSGDDMLKGGLIDEIIGGAGIDYGDFVERIVKAAPDTLSSVTANLTNKLLVVRGTSGNDTIRITRSGSNIRAAGQNFAISAVNRIVIAGHAGNDNISIAANVPKASLIFGGWGTDTINGGSRRDEIHGGGGGDVINGNGGNDMIYGGAQFDTLNGGAGTDIVKQNSVNRARAMTTFEKKVANLTNARRRQAGLANLRFDNRLAAASDFHSANIRRRIAQTNLNTGFAHSLWGVLQPTVDTRIDYAGFEATTYGENIAYGYTTPASVVNGWMQSPGHRANILNPNFKFIGVGVIKATNGTKIFTQVFGDKV